MLDVNPRKSPRQARAKATVDAIVEATTQLLLQEGYERFTTARAAERAGVSIGSLYQYFPNKAALATAVIDRCCDDFLAVFRDSLARREGRALADRINAIIAGNLISHRLTPGLHRIVNELAPQIGVAGKAARVSRSVAMLIEALLRGHAKELSPDIDLATAASIIQVVLEALSHRIRIHDPQLLPDDILAREAHRLITRYLGIAG